MQPLALAPITQWAAAVALVTSQERAQRLQVSLAGQVVQVVAAAAAGLVTVVPVQVPKATTAATVAGLETLQAAAAVGLTLWVLTQVQTSAVTVVRD